MKSLDFFKQEEIHYKSKSGSLYFYAENGVYRYSNHWGRVANCKWKIKGVEAYKNQIYYVGYAKWSDFYPLNSKEKNFYIIIEVETNEPKIFRVKEGDKTTPFLMTLEFALLRLKEIKKLYKDYKWATYYNETVEVVRNKLIYKLINSDKTLQVLKQSLKNDLE
ncbi:hypothetical protein MHL31_15645 [Lutibacter sp. A80]|uniref:hypothetical protein n=1 Tax=Lutibacter sp. A80 TaxID=2918453 RepID=UPI001F0704D4|nr:hypothetical protein [Lutibacter sp. A80]UMB60502.1 hypothetical protein MHL31_15645 [Lutibacter sp. A80]